MMYIGDSLKEIRKKKQLTLKQLAETADLSAAYLSKLENNLTSPTLANLQKICEALQITMAEFLIDDQEDPPRVLKKSERPELFKTGSGILYKLLFDRSTKVKIISMTIQEDNYKEEMSWGHHDDELGIVAEGSLVITIGEDNYVLLPGDFIYIKAHEVHQYKKVGEGACTVYWIYVPEADH
ncbi:helix-turn-helix domain-containing protein [Ruminococcaceae bacterium OttesenSCG-928-I18]|nr:helix-turn-helix domain-containing protein [Ruminococcaceae bacterium OttesenSCG-928-I18]